MGVLDKFLDAIKLNDDYEDDEFLDDDYEDDEDDGDFLDDDLDDKPKKKFFEKFGRKKSDDEFDDLDDFDEEPKASAKAAAAKAPANAKQPEKPVRTAQSSKITPMRSSSRRDRHTSNVEVCVIKPTSMEDTREIADTLLDNSTVILNLEGIDVELAQRIIDFASGSCYSLNGSLQKISSYIFVLGPASVDITGDLQNILGGSIPSVRAGY